MCVSLFIYRSTTPQNKSLTPSDSTTESSPTLAPRTKTSYSGPLSSSLFVPYWAVTGRFTSPEQPRSILTTLIYFGVAPLSDGSINTSGQDYANLQTFTQLASLQLPEANTLLAIRMLDEDNNSLILESEALQFKLVNEALFLVQQHDFDGILLDLEHSVLPTTTVTQQILVFAQSFASTMHQNDLTFNMALYGDTYYRSRPYDVQNIGTFTDTIYIMAYDFHKSYGLPGPNFPLSHDTAYPYSFELMLQDFTQDVPANNLVVIFGMYGYDWSIDEQGRPLKSAKPASLNTFLQHDCPPKSCSKQQDPKSTETELQYTDSTGQKHIAWYETFSSVTAKVEKARTFEVSKIGFWAHTYY